MLVITKKTPDSSNWEPIWRSKSQIPNSQKNKGLPSQPLLKTDDLIEYSVKMWLGKDSNGFYNK